MLEYSQSHFMTSGTLWNYYRDEIDDVDNNALDSKTFKYKTKTAGKILEWPPQPGNPGNANWGTQPVVPTLNVEITISHQYFSNFWRFLDSPLISHEMELDLSWAKDCLLIEHHNNITGVNLWLLALNFIF